METSANPAGEVRLLRPTPGSPEVRAPLEQDAEAIWSLIQRTPALDQNSLYTYLLWCRYFADTSAVAKIDGELAGFVSGLLDPKDLDRLFIWQVVVDPRRHQSGLATQMIEHLLRRPGLAHIVFLEATVAPSNAASMALFRKIARLQNAALEILEGFPASLFGETGHEAEPMIRIGPLT